MTTLDIILAATVGGAMGALYVLIAWVLHKG